MLLLLAALLDPSRYGRMIQLVSLLLLLTPLTGDARRSSVVL